MYPDITVDYIMSMGPACRPAQSLRRNNLRLVASPFDWMMNYNIQQIYNFFKNGFDTFFSNLGDMHDNINDRRKIIDYNTGMISIHDFPINVSAIDYYPIFFKKMHNRFQRLCYILSESSCILFLGNRTYNYTSISTFLLSMESIFPNKYFIYANIENQENDYFNIIDISEKLHIFDIRFNDTYCGKDKCQLSWLGNTKKWDSFLSHVKLTPLTSNILAQKNHD